MDDGQFKERRRWLSNPFQYNLTWKLETFRIAAIFEAWIEYAIQSGTGEFDVPIMGGKRVRSLTGNANFTPNGMGWIATMAVQEIRTPGPISAPSGLPLWPSTLPDLEADSFQIMRTNSPIKSEEDGLMQMRERFKTRYTPYQGSFLMTQAQRDEFWTFYYDVLLTGLSWFSAPFANPSYQGKLRARFTESPTETENGCIYRVDVKLETVSAPLMSRLEYDTATAEFVDNYFAPGYVVDGYAGQEVLP